ncbi:hypothetical protein IWQ61_002558 [Dispira simplex]|nr:hypothetical protein IWQ61_002558 [Dispira simplex]
MSDLSPYAALTTSLRRLQAEVEALTEQHTNLIGQSNNLASTVHDLAHTMAEDKILVAER